MKRFPGLACLFLLAACTVFRQWEERIEFVRLYKHEVGHYSVDIKTPDGKIISRDLCNPLCPQKMDIFDDVGDGKQMWMRIVLGENVIVTIIHPNGRREDRIERAKAVVVINETEDDSPFARAA